MSEPLRLATRGSALARWQADAVAAALSALLPERAVEPLIVRSSGDADQTTALARFGRIGIFTVEVDRALLDERARVGVHSLKDLTTTLQDGVVLGGVLPRGPVEDVLVGARLEELPAGARVATGSMRRRAMLLRARPDLECVDIRGNVGTRLKKLASGEAEALLMARAGLVRLALERHVAEVLDVDRFLPAVGQGIVGLTCRADDDEMVRWLRDLGDRHAWAAAHAERAFLGGLRGGCNVPVGAHATATPDGQLWLRAQVLSTDGRSCLAGERSGAPDQAVSLGEDLAGELLAQGAERLLEDARS